MVDEFYKKAFSRNIGLLTDEEQEILSKSRVAIAGLGGLGGRHFASLARMGFGGFNIADIDEFDVVNINRQIGATSSTVGKKKTDVMAAMIKDINPGVALKIYDEGVQPDNAVEFLENVDAVVDSIDFFQMKARRLLYKTARDLGKTVVFSAPLGFSGTLHIFTPDSMSFEEYYDINDSMSPYDQLVAFAVGLCPRGTHLAYMDSSKVDLTEHRGPSLACGCEISTGLLTTEILSVVLGRRKPKAVPHYAQFDPYRRVYRTGYLPWGNRGPIQQLKRFIMSQRFKSQKSRFNEMAAKSH